MLTISIHAPRGGSDQGNWKIRFLTSDFNPRSPWGERLGLAIWFIGLISISIHAPRGGSDVSPQ